MAKVDGDNTKRRTRRKPEKVDEPDVGSKSGNDLSLPEGYYSSQKEMDQKTIARVLEHINRHCPEWDDIALDPFEYMRHTDRRRDYFKFFMDSSPCWRSIEYHLRGNPGSPILSSLFMKGCGVDYVKDSPNSVSIEEITPYVTSHDGVDCIGITVEMDYNGYEYEHSSVVTCKIYIPYELLVDFSTKKFNAWVKSNGKLKREREEKSNLVEYERLKKLLKK